MKNLVIAFLISIFMVTSSYALEIQKLLPADDEIIAEVSKAMKHDVDQTIRVVVYSKEWEYHNVDKLVNSGKAVIKKLVKNGIDESRITLFLCNDNKFGNYTTIIIPSDGTYLFLE